MFGQGRHGQVQRFHHLLQKIPTFVSIMYWVLSTTLFCPVWLVTYAWRQTFDQMHVLYY